MSCFEIQVYLGNIKGDMHLKRFVLFYHEAHVCYFILK